MVLLAQQKIPMLLATISGVVFFVHSLYTPALVAPQNAS